MVGRLSRPVALTFGAGMLFLLLSASTSGVIAQSAQNGLLRGQNIAPSFEGWEKNPDGSFNLVFGYFNRNWEEEFDIPVGPNNNLEPSGPDQGQPTHFFPRRNRFVFRIRVPSDFGKKEIVWTLTVNGKTEKAYGTLLGDYFMDYLILEENYGGSVGGPGNPELVGNKAPTLKVGGAKTIQATVGHPITLIASSEDDGVPHQNLPRYVNDSTGGQTGNRTGRGARESFEPATTASASPTPLAAVGLRLSWFLYRGPGSKVTFDPPQIQVWEDYRPGRNSPWSRGWVTPPPPPDHKWVTRVTFGEPGTYVLRAQAHDGALATSDDVTVIVK